MLRERYLCPLTQNGTDRYHQHGIWNLLRRHFSGLGQAFYQPLSFPGWDKRHCCAAVIPGDSPVESVALNGIRGFLDIYTNLLVARVLLSWFPNLNHSTGLRPLYAISDPLLGLVPKSLKRLVGVDLAPIMVIIFIQTLDLTAHALGAELPLDEKLPGRRAVGAGPRQVQTAGGKKCRNEKSLR